ncbi:MAG: DNRLRE domain-containing protein [Candidatus Omnitrophota bacterium]
MKNFIKMLFFVLVVLSFIPHAHAIIVDLPTMADATVLSNQPNVNAGDDALFAQDETQHAYLKFDLTSIPDTAILNSVTLNVWNPSWTANDIVEIFHVFDDSWAENTITWNNRPALEGYPEYPLSSVSTAIMNNVSHSFDIFQFGVPDYTPDLVDNFVTFAFTTQGNGIFIFDNREAESLGTGSAGQTAAFLRTEYTAQQSSVVPEPTSMILFSLGLLGIGFKRKPHK